MTVAAAPPVFDGPISDRQLSGYWYAPWEDIPALQPGFDPTGAVIPQDDWQQITVEPGFRALDLVRVNYKWVVLSWAGVWTYSHSAGAMSNEFWKFATWDGGQRRVFQVQGEPVALEFRAIGDEYGNAAAQRARNDYDAVILVLRSA